MDQVVVFQKMFEQVRKEQNFSVSVQPEPSGQNLTN